MRDEAMTDETVVALRLALGACMGLAPAGAM